MNDVALLPTIALCAGGGGLERGLAHALAPLLQLRPVLYVEREAFAAAYLVEEMAAGRLPEAPVWASVAHLDPSVLRSLRRLARTRPVAITAGFPCQPHSAAGKQLHTEDHRWIWPEIGNWIRQIRPSLVVLENVPGLALHGLDACAATLAEAGYAARWDLFRASEAGSPQRRERLFLVGVLPDALGNRLRLLAERGLGPARSTQPRDTEPGDLGETVADALRSPTLEGRRKPGRPAHHGGRRILPPFPPGPRDWRAWKAALDAGRWDLLPALTRSEERLLAGTDDERLQERRSLQEDEGGSGSIEGSGRMDRTREAPQPPLRGVAPGLVTRRRVDGLRLLGNAVVPQQAALAIQTLLIDLLAHTPHPRPRAEHMR